MGGNLGQTTGVNIWREKWCWRRWRWYGQALGAARMCWVWVRTLSRVGLASGSPRAAAYIFGARVPPLEDGACHDESIRAPILRGAWVPPPGDDACHDGTFSNNFEGEMVVVAAAAAAVVAAAACFGATYFARDQPCASEEKVVVVVVVVVLVVVVVVVAVVTAAAAAVVVVGA